MMKFIPSSGCDELMTYGEQIGDYYEYCEPHFSSR